MDTMTLQAFQALKIPHVSYADYMNAGGLDAVRALSDERLGRLATMLIHDRCAECGEPIYAIDYSRRVSGSDKLHDACQEIVDARRADPPVKQWRWHAHGEIWAGADGTIMATSRDEAYARVRAWAADLIGSSGDEQGAADSDELGPYVRVDPLPVGEHEPHPGPGSEDPVGLAEIADLLGVTRQTADNWRTRGALPPPRWTVGGRPAWAWGAIHAWAVSTGRGATSRGVSYDPASFAPAVPAAQVYESYARG